MRMASMSGIGREFDNIDAVGKFIANNLKDAEKARTESETREHFHGTCYQ